MSLDRDVLPSALEVLAALQAGLAATANPPQHYRVVPGVEMVAAIDPNSGVDEVCQGVAWVRITGVHPCADFPEPIGAPEAAQGITPTSLAVALEIGVVRCGPEPTPTMVTPDDVYLTAVSAVMDDAAVMRRLGESIMATTTVIVDYLTGSWVPLEAEGGGIGGVMTLTLQVPFLDC